MSRAAFVALLLLLAVPATAEPVVVGSKAFPESWILAEAVRISLERAAVPAEHRRNLGGTEIVYQALRSGAVDVYPEYTGTIAELLLKQRRATDLVTLRTELRRRGLTFSAPLGFNNGYAIAVSRASAGRCRLGALSELGRCKPFALGLSHEFLGRADGYPGLAARYGLELDVRGMQHELAYEAVARGAIDGLDVYTTDPQIDVLGLKLLDDDRHFFPRYDAVLLHRIDLPPTVTAVFEGFAGRIDERSVRAANAAVALRREPVDAAARQLLGHGASSARRETWREIAAHTRRHLELVLAALGAAIVIGVPAGIWATRSAWARAAVLSVANLLQTIPSLALLSLLIPLLGIGFWPSLAALFLYGLLPILRNTCVAIASIPALYVDAARAIALAPRFRLLRVELPLALPTVIAGVRTSAVISVGTATLAALIGAGGLGSPILEGIALRDTSRILSGAVPVAVLALAIDALFAGLERWLAPRGLRISSRAL